MEIKLDSLINENRGEIRINISVKNHPDELWRRFASVDMPRLIPHNGRAGHIYRSKKWKETHMTAI